MTESRTQLTYPYPGSLYPEHGRTVRVDVVSKEEARRHSPDAEWFAAGFSTQDWQRWTDGEGNEKWLPVDARQAVKRRVYVGEAMNAERVAALPGDHSILLSNMRCNDWPTVVRTRAGNFQPVEAGDVVISENAWLA